MAVQEIVASDDSFSLARKVGDAVRRKRKLSGLTLREVADLCGTTPQTLQRMEVAKMTLSLDWLEKIAAALGCEPVDFFVGPVELGGRKAEALMTIKDAVQDMVANAEQERLRLNAILYSQLAILGEKE